MSARHRRQGSVLGNLVEHVGKHAEDLGYTIYPSAKSTVREQISRAIDKGVIHGGDEAKLVAAALFSGAVDRAGETGLKHIGAREIKAGWAEKVSVRGYCPPILCMTRSILRRKEELERELGSFRAIYECHHEW
jgi:hypothetical protein